MEILSIFFLSFWVNFLGPFMHLVNLLSWEKSNNTITMILNLFTSNEASWPVQNERKIIDKILMVTPYLCFLGHLPHPSGNSSWTWGEGCWIWGTVSNIQKYLGSRIFRKHFHGFYYFHILPSVTVINSQVCHRNILEILHFLFALSL